MRRLVWLVKVFIQLVKNIAREVKRMKRIMLTVLLCTLAATMFFASVRPAKAYIDTVNWIGESHSYDIYWHSYYLIAFEEGTTAQLAVRVYNNWAYNLNVSAVIVYMDWNQNYSSAQASETTPSVMPPYTYRTFLITFTVPDVTVASNLYSHGYTVYVEYLNGTGHKQPYDDWSFSSGFYVYSSDQKECMRLYDEIQAMFNAYGSSPGFSTNNASVMWKEGYMLYQLGYNAHSQGAFTDAMNYYNNALDKMNTAIGIEADYDLNWQNYNDASDRAWDNIYMQEEQAYALNLEAQANATIMEADAMSTNASARVTLAQAALTQSYAVIVFGIGFIVFGIAAIVWANKRPRP
jgi:hypothetical protein